jgi:purine-binding chemotaxis protein CheW
MTALRSEQVPVGGGDGVFVTLNLAGQLCGLPVGCVRDVLRHQAIVPVALSPSEVAGNLNLRGHIVTALDLRRRLGLPPAPRGSESQAVVTEDRGEMFALIADKICDVITPQPGLFEPVPPTLPDRWARFSAGLYRLPKELLIVLDLSRLLALQPALA